MNQPDFQTKPGLTLMQRVEDAFVYYQYAQRTQLSYSRWIRSYIHYLKERNVDGQRYHNEIPLFLKYLETEKKMSDASRIQARNAIVFLFEKVFGLEVKAGAHSAKIRNDPPLPVVMAPEQIKKVLCLMQKKHRLMAGLMYGAGLRLMECVRLRICQLDFEQSRIHILPPGKGRQRKTLLPETLKHQLTLQIKTIREMHQLDCAMGGGQTILSAREEKAYRRRDKDLEVQYLFPGRKMVYHQETGTPFRPCVAESGIQKAFKAAVKRAGLSADVSCSTLRHSFAVHLLENNVSIYDVQQLMGHTDIRSTQVYLKLMQDEKQKIGSPLDRFGQL